MNDSGDMTLRIVNSAVEHWPLLAGLVVAVWKGMPWALRAFYANGGGDLVRAIVRSENKEQSAVNREYLDQRLKEHESREKERFDAGEARFRDIEDDLDELSAETGSVRLRTKHHIKRARARRK